MTNAIYAYAIYERHDTYTYQCHDVMLTINDENKILRTAEFPTKMNYTKNIPHQ